MLKKTKYFYYVNVKFALLNNFKMVGISDNLTLRKI